MDNSDITAVILAGGKGTRIKELYPDVPKPLITVQDEGFLYWVTAWYANQGIQDFVYSAGHMADQIESWVQTRDMSGLDRKVRVETKPLGTGGGLLFCLDVCKEWILVANGDSLCLADLTEFLELRHRTDLAGAILGVDVEDATRYGTLDFDNENRLLAFKEKEPGAGTINSGTYMFRKSELEHLNHPGYLSIEYNLIPELILSDKMIYVHRIPSAEFIDIGIPDTVVQAEDFIKRNQPRFLWSLDKS